MIKKVILAVMVILAIIVILNLINQIMAALKSGERLSRAAETIYKLEQKNKQLRKKLTEIKSPQFLEEQARNKLGLVREGETVVIIPDEKIKQILGATQSAQVRLPNWLGWLKVFWH